jgi:putative flippase GtrA
MNQPTPLPTTKVTAGALAGALSIILVWTASSVGLEVPAEVAAAWTVILTALVQYVTPEN